MAPEMDRSSVSPITDEAAASPARSSKRACDQCKLRKVKCSLSQPCATCLSRNFECTYLKPQRKRGPLGNRLSQIQRQQIQLTKQNHFDESNEMLSPSDSRQLPTQSNLESYQSLPEANNDSTQLEDVVDFIYKDLQAPGTNIAACEVDFAAPSMHNGFRTSNNYDAEYWPPDRVSMQLCPFGLPQTNLFVDSALPLIVETNSDGNGVVQHEPSHPRPPMYNLLPSQNGFEATDNIWPSSISEVNLIPWIEVYFDRLHPTLPVLNRSSLLSRMFLHEHHQNPLFGSMLLALCAFAITQPILINERSTTSTRANQAKRLMNEAIKMRSSADFGESPELEAVLTSFFLFGCLFGSNQHNAAWLRLREAVDLALTMGLNKPDSYQLLSNEEKGQHIRVYLILSITEKAYAIQRQHPINFRLIPGFDRPLSNDIIHDSSHGLLSGVVVYNEKDAAALMGLSLLMELFCVINDDDINCWNGTCGASQGCCTKHDENEILSLHKSMSRVDCQHHFRDYDRINLNDSNEPQRVAEVPFGFNKQCLISQFADILITQKWLQNRIWQLCLTHSLLKAQSEHGELTFNYAVSIAESTLDLCQSLSLQSMEAHGIDRKALRHRDCLSNYLI
ncbi:hypothetical protein TrVFT333_007952 [Trichoderma virens FT-333]|nr:hypothetical protein TrVFT333_007952 [Trichoderma virens FT-333]